MPINVTWKSMCESMRKTYAGGPTKCRPFTDGTKVCMSQKAWQVFFATINKMGADETKPRPPRKTQEAREKLLKWFMESKQDDEPRWLKLALKVINSDKFSDKVKDYWRSRLQKYCKDNPDNKVCKGLKA